MFKPSGLFGNQLTSYKKIHKLSSFSHKIWHCLFFTKKIRAYLRKIWRVRVQKNALQIKVEKSSTHTQRARWGFKWVRIKQRADNKTAEIKRLNMAEVNCSALLTAGVNCTASRTTLPTDSGLVKLLFHEAALSDNQAIPWIQSGFVHRCHECIECNQQTWKKFLKWWKPNQRMRCWGFRCVRIKHKADKKAAEINTLVMAVVNCWSLPKERTKQCRRRAAAGKKPRAWIWWKIVIVKLVFSQVYRPSWGKYGYCTKRIKRFPFCWYKCKQGIFNSAIPEISIKPQ